jgi:hypothetical protein
VRTQKESAQQRLPGGIGQFEVDQRESVRRNPAKFRRICSGMRCGASGEPKAGF